MSTRIPPPPITDLRRMEWPISIQNWLYRLDRLAQTTTSEFIEGNNYKAWFNQIGVAASANVDMAITTPNTTMEGLFCIEVSGTKDFTAYLYEGATVSAGSTFTPVLQDRTLSIPSVMTVKTAPTVTGTGTAISSALSGGPDEEDTTKRWVFKRGTTYLVRVTSGADANNISLQAHWFEYRGS